MNKKNAIYGTIFSSLILLTGCGGGGGGGGGESSKPQTQTTLSGVVAKGEPLPGYVIKVISASNMAKNGGTGMGLTMTDQNGHYSITMGFSEEPPFLIEAAKARDSDVNHLDDIRQADGNYPRLYSIALKAGTANVTPLTDLLVLQLSGKPIKEALNYSAIAQLSQAQIDTARQAVVDYLLHRPSKYQQSMTMPVDASKISDFITTPFQPVNSDSYDTVLQQLQETLTTGENIFSLETHMLDRSITAADLSAIDGPGVNCVGPSCSTYVNLNSVYYSKYALIKRLRAQLAGMITVDCGSTSSAGGLHTGTNRFYLDDSILRINDLTDSSTTLSLLSATQLSFGFAESTTGAGKYIASVSADSLILASYFSLGFTFSETALEEVTLSTVPETNGARCTII